MVIIGLSTEDYGSCIRFPTQEYVSHCGGGVGLGFLVMKMEIGFSNCEHTFNRLMQPISLTWHRRIQGKMICSRKVGERFVNLLAPE